MINQKSRNNLISVCIFSTLVAGMFANAEEPGQLPPPEYSTTDRLSVDVTTGNITTNIPTVAIGGERGIAHHVNSGSNSFFSDAEANTRGFKDKFGGGASLENVFGEAFQQTMDAYGLSCHDWLSLANGGAYVMLVHDHEGSQMFTVDEYNGKARCGLQSIQSDTSRGTYTALRDKRHTLEVPYGRTVPVEQQITSGTQPGPEAYLLWTKPDGTEVWIYRGATAKAADGGILKKIIYPNGISLENYDRSGSILTNTGFQLKYNYPADNRPPLGIGSGIQYSLPPENNPMWSHDNPATVLGINMAVERCPTNRSGLCVPEQSSCNELRQNGAVGVSGQTCTALSAAWPMAKFTWPRGMPRALYFGSNDLTVADADNRTTRLHFTGYDACEHYPAASACQGLPSGYYRVPRIEGLTNPGSVSRNVNYGFSTAWDKPSGMTAMDLWYGLASDVGYLASGTGIMGSHTYGQVAVGQPPHAPSGQNPFSKYRHGYQMEVWTRTDLFGAVTEVETAQAGNTIFETNFRNNPLYRLPLSGPTEHYYYDSRGNLTKITYNKNMPSETYVEAQFPTSCTTTNRKYCNKAEWISDAKGNVTSYTYHSQSGQIESITSPADADGKIAQTRFEYQQKQARYLNESNAYIYGSPIWLKTAEKYCIDSNFVNGSCVNNDEVVTTYAYDSDNLFLTSVTVTAPNSSFRRTCYEYDKYGNQIGETQPEGNCN